MHTREINTVDGVIDALGGTSATAKLTARKSQHVSNWRKEKRIPARFIHVLQGHLAARNLIAPSRLWGVLAIAPPPAPRRKTRSRSG